MSDALYYLSATEAVAAFRQGTLSPVDLTRAVIDRAEATHASVNAFADRYFDEAMERARRAEAKYRSGRGLRRLEGVPLAVKDSFSIAGRRSTRGSLINQRSVDQRTDPTVERLLRTGANLIGRTTCPEFCWLFTTHSRMWGVTRNPWRLDVTPGGSSGGSAAALSSGASTIALGSDSTGSIRQPAAQCGVVGYQGPYGRFPLGALAPFDPYLNVGPMARTVSDAALMTTIMAGPHPLDHNALPGRVRLPAGPAEIGGLKVAFSVDLGHYEIDPDVERETRAALAALSDAGAEVTEIDVSWASRAIRLAHGHEEFLFAPDIEAAVRDHPELVSDYAVELLETARSFTADDYRDAISEPARIWAEHLGPLFTRFDAFVCPTVSSPEVPAENWQRGQLEVNGRAVTDTDTAMTALFNMLSRCPVLAVPSGMTDRGLPTGVQIVGRPHDDATVFRVGFALESARPWPRGPEQRPGD